MYYCISSIIEPKKTKNEIPDSNVEPVLLDIQSCKPDIILLMDTFFNVIVWHGRDVAEWVRQKVHEQSEYAYLKAILEKVNADARVLKYEN